MIKFTDPRLYVKGTCQINLADVSTGEIKYFSNKFQTNNIQTSATLDPIRGGYGNPIATIIASDADVKVTAVAADFSLWAKMAQVGGTLSYNATIPACQVVTAEGAALTIDVTDGAPVANYGYSDIFCYVQEAGAGATIAATGTPYPLDAATGAITGFTATTGKQYKVWYWVKKAGAQVGVMSTMFAPGVYHMTAQIAVFSNEGGGGQNEGTRVGWLYYIIPRLKMGAVANLVGDQTTADTTELSGQALAYDEDVISATCTDCDMPDLAYYIYAPDDGSSAIAGLAVVGGAVTVQTGATAQIPVKYVMPDGQLVQPVYTALKYTLGAGAPAGTSVSTSGVITAGSAAGETEVTITYPAEGTAQHTCVANVSVVSA